MSSWKQVNLNLIAKAIGEMVFEENISLTHRDEYYCFTTSKNINYRFKGQMSLWGWIKVDPLSIERNDLSATSASQFFIDTQEFSKMSDITLAQFIEEMRSTLFADLHLNHEVSADEFIKLNFLDSQQLLNGHPKILLNKGRLGWSTEDWKKYAPENGPVFALKLIAVENSIVKGERPEREHYLSLVTDSRLSLIEQTIDLSHYSLLPVHPWQWNNVINYHFQNEIQQQQLIDLGETSFHFSPQISLRTLNCIENLAGLEVKLPLSILNTSCIRGIPDKTVELGVHISQALHTIINEDSFLRQRVDILSETAGINVVSHDLSQIEKAPYRFHEFLGVIWRESAMSKVSKKQTIILTANLLYQDQHQQSALGAYIKASGLDAASWMKEYASVVILPLLHLQTQYGIGLVSHGQNVMLILENNRPQKLVIKDFQGDFRLSTTAPEKTKNIFGDLFNRVTQLPPEHLIHDLYTAHFVTLLRYVGMILNNQGLLSEHRFYQALSEVIIPYEREFNCEKILSRPIFEKILVNSVRFAIGYGDSANRPLPLLGTTINNPLHQVTI